MTITLSSSISRCKNTSILYLVIIALVSKGTLSSIRITDHMLYELDILPKRLNLYKASPNQTFSTLLDYNGYNLSNYVHSLSVGY